MLGKIAKTFSIKWMIIYGIVPPFFTAVTFLYILGVARYVTDFEENTCEMTYMFEYPQYVVRKCDKKIVHYNFLIILDKFVMSVSRSNLLFQEHNL